MQYEQRTITKTTSKTWTNMVGQTKTGIFFASLILSRTRRKRQYILSLRRTTKEDPIVSQTIDKEYVVHTKHFSMQQLSVLRSTTTHFLTYI